ncbi:MAG: hypothetical protein LBE84_12700 [Planctomycetota bacterium]|nr:hypothetical protein [Planctomycetota bacterium]
MEIIILILKALLGLDTAEKAPPRPRRRRRAVVPDEQGSRHSSDPGETERPIGMEDIFTQIFGETAFGKEEQGGRSEPVLRIPPQSPFAPGEPNRRPWPEPASGDSTIPTAPTDSWPEGEAIEPIHPPPAIPGGEKPIDQSLPPSFRLRGNPALAREAFIYSEIFGRPLAEGRRNDIHA